MPVAAGTKKGNMWGPLWCIWSIWVGMSAGTVQPSNQFSEIDQTDEIDWTDQ